MIDTIYFDGASVVILDQNQLPDQVAYEHCTSPEEVAEAIRSLTLRGAPLIGVAAAYGLALAVLKFQGEQSDLVKYFDQTRQELAATRPTAVNLFWALKRMDSVYQRNSHLSVADIGAVLLKEAQQMHVEDIRTNQLIGDYGADLFKQPVRVMTICNAGALATCGYGTALGVIRSAHARGNIKQVWACETRPVLQGARLTVWELHEDNIPVTLITDNMAGYTMKRGEVDAIIVGADRIAANGDTANKIGTYSLAVLARHHHIPFYVAAPFSTIDLGIACGSDIPIEERNAEEVRSVRGVRLTLADTPVFNPAFDVTGHELIAGIITEKGVLLPPYEVSLNPDGERI